MANFSKSSGNSTKDVELIAVKRSNNVAFDQNGKPVAYYVDVMVNNMQANIEKGEGQALPNLYTKQQEYVSKDTGEVKQGYNHGIRLTAGQMDTIMAVGGNNILSKNDGTQYIPFKADLMPLREKQFDADGKVIMDPNTPDKPLTKMVGYMPNTKTVQASDYGLLTEEGLKQHFDNTKAVNERDKKIKNAQMSAAAHNDLSLSGNQEASFQQSM